MRLGVPFGKHTVAGEKDDAPSYLLDHELPPPTDDAQLMS